MAVFPLDQLHASGSHDVTVERTIPVPVSPSFLNYSRGILWMGNFCHPKADYNLSPELNFTTPSADGEYGCYILDSARQSEAMTVMPMTEALCLSPAGVLVLFESGSSRYSDGKYRTDHVWEVKGQ